MYPDWGSLGDELVEESMEDNATSTVNDQVIHKQRLSHGF